MAKSPDGTVSKGILTASGRKEDIAMEPGMLKEAFLDRQSYWGWQCLEEVISDADWRALLERDVAMGEIGEDARRIFAQYGAIEHCSGGLPDLVKGQFRKIGRLDPDYTFAVRHDDMTRTFPMTCGTCSREHRDRFLSYLDALADWLDGGPADDEVQREVGELLGEPTEPARAAVQLVVDRIRADWHALDILEMAETTERLKPLLERNWNPEGNELFPGQPQAPLECRILWLLSCNWHAVEDLKIILREIRTGEYPGGFIGHGYCPNYLDVLDPLFSAAGAWMRDDCSGGGRAGEILGDPNAEKRWLVATFTKYISDGQAQAGHGRIRALGQMIDSL